MARHSPRFALLVLLACLGSAGCKSFGGRSGPPPPPPPPPVTAGTPLTPEPAGPPAAEATEEYLPVEKVSDLVVVAAWAEPKQLPAGGGQTQILVRIQKSGGRRYPGVQVRLKASTGTLYSKGSVLVTDAQGMTRDQLTTRTTAIITLNAGGTRYRFLVPVTEPSR